MIELVKSGKDRASTYRVYIPMGTQDLAARMQVYVGDVPGFDDNDNEAFQFLLLSLGLSVDIWGSPFSMLLIWRSGRSQLPPVLQERSDWLPEQFEVLHVEKATVLPRLYKPR